MGDLAYWGSGGTPKSDVAEYYGGSIPWVITADLTDGPVSTSTRTITELGLAKSSAKLVPSGTVLVAMYGASIGRVGIASMPLATNQAIANAQIHTQATSPTYILYYLLSQRSALMAAGKGAAQPNIGQGILKEWPIPVAPLAEQERIVAAIEEQFSRLDAGVAALRRARRNLQRARAAALEQLTWADMDGSRQALALGSLIEDVRTGLDRGRVRQRTQPPGYGYVKMADVRDGIVDLSTISYVDASPDEVAVGELRDGDILFNNRNSRELVGKSGLVVSPPTGTLYNNNLVRLRTGKAILPKFMALQLCSPTILRQLDRMKSATTNVAAIYTRDLLTLRVNTPSLATQRTALEVAENQLAAIGHIGSALAINEQRAVRLRSSLLATAFSGQLVAQDSTDEPASVLLERIAAERAASNGNKPTRNRKLSAKSKKVTA